MSTPPRRRRTEPRRPTPGGGGGWLPTIAMGLGVIVAGLGIGALVAVFMQRGPSSQQTAVVSTAQPSPVPSPATRPPIAIATIEPLRTPRPSPRPSPSASPSAEPTATASPRPSATPTDRPSPQPTLADSSATPAPPGVASASRVAVVTPMPAATDVPTSAPASPPAPAGSATPASVPTAPPTPVPTSAPATTTAPSAPSGYEEHASAVVRRYINALIHGDEKTAYTALGETPGSAPGALTEQAILDPSARIVSLKVTRVDAANASVGCEIDSAKGHYYATFHVAAASSGPYITEHDYIKV